MIKMILVIFPYIQKIIQTVYKYKTLNNLNKSKIKISNKQ